MAFGFDLAEDVGDLAVVADEERCALDAHDLLAVHVLLFDHAEGVADLLVGVGEQSEGEIVLLLELLLGFGFIGGDAENDEAGLLEFCVRVAEPARFNRSTGSVCFGVEEQHHVLSLELLERNAVAVLVREAKIKCFAVDVHDSI